MTRSRSSRSTSLAAGPRTARGVALIGGGLVVGAAIARLLDKLRSE